MLWVIEVPDPGAEERIARVQQLIIFCKYKRVTFDSPPALWLWALTSGPLDFFLHALWALRPCD